MDNSIMVMKSNLIILILCWKPVIKIMMEPLTGVKSTIVSLWLKMNGELNTVKKVMPNFTVLLQKNYV